MKKTLRIMGLCALAVLALAGCKKDEQTTSTIKATLTQPTGNAKTHIGNALYLVWDADDDIIVYTKDKTESATFSLTAGAETPNATFSGSIAESDSITAFYPKEGVDVTGEGKFVLPMSGSQTYKTNSFDTKTYPMCATAKVGDDLEFHSPYGLLGLQLKGSATVGSIELTGNNNEDLVGHYEIGSDTVFVANGEKTITLTFGTSGLVLDENTIDTVYFVLPAVVFADGFTAVVKNTANDIIDNLTTTNKHTIRRERIRMMSPKTLAEVQTEDPSVTSNSVTLHGTVVYEGPVGDIQAHGFTYSTIPDFEGPTGTPVPVTDWDNAKGTYTFQTVLNDLPVNTPFYYRAYFNLTLDPATIEYGGIKQFTITEQTYTITVSANPSAAGIVDGAGTYTLGQSHTVTATANPGYAFVNWTEGSNVVSTNASYEFNIEGNRSLVANFVATYTIAATANPTDGGTVTGGGPYNQGASCTLTATANEGYTFTNWTEGGTVVSTNANYQFTVTGNRTLQANFVQQHTITATANPTDGGSVTGGGTYNQGASCTLTATANEGYTFTNWTEGGTVVSTNANYQFTVTGNRTLQANFVQQHTITATANPTDGGTVTGGGPYNQGASCTLTATANEGYTFTNWTEGGTVVSTNANYQFTVTGNRTLQANFAPAAPVGDINALFSVSATKQVYFSQGNLQYIGSASTPYWKFADNQWDYFGTTTGQNGTNQNVDRDLFGWGTWTGSATNPANTSSNDTDYSWDNSDFVKTLQNGSGTWRTLTSDEWLYLFKTRASGATVTTTSGTTNDARYTQATINTDGTGVNGIILFPDGVTIASDEATTWGAINGSSAYGTKCTAAQWAALDAKGCVFLPAAGFREGTSVDSVGTIGLYWSSEANGPNHAKRLYFFSNFVSPQYGNFRRYGQSVRLVQDYN